MYVQYRLHTVKHRLLFMQRPPVENVFVKKEKKETQCRVFQKNIYLFLRRSQCAWCVYSTFQCSRNIFSTTIRLPFLFFMTYNFIFQLLSFYCELWWWRQNDYVSNCMYLTGFGLVLSVLCWCIVFIFCYVMSMNVLYISLFCCTFGVCFVVLLMYCEHLCYGCMYFSLCNILMK